MINWDDYKNFSKHEFACKHTGICKVVPELVQLMQDLRDKTGKPLHISSGYRHPTHPIEAMKDKPGEHAHGMSADVICNSRLAQEILFYAMQFGVNRIGINQKGKSSNRFIHLGISDWFNNDFPKNAVWTY